MNSVHDERSFIAHSLLLSANSRLESTKVIGKYNVNSVVGLVIKHRPHRRPSAHPELSRQRLRHAQ